MSAKLAGRKEPRNRIWKPLLVVCLVTGMGAALAQSDYPRDITISWTNPTEYTDGSPILDGDLAHIRVTCVRQNGVTAFDDQVTDDVTPGAAVSRLFVDSIPQPGTYECTAFAVTVDGTSSDPSNSTFKRYTGKPLPPTSVQ